MTQVLDELVALLSLETIEENLFRGASQDLGFRQLFGGQVIGQSLSAASQTVAADRHMHSMHGYFLRPGDATLPVVYEVDRVRDGGSFNTRRVLAIQKGRPIFSCSVSFQHEEEGFSHQVPQMPDVPGPEELPRAQLLSRNAGLKKLEGQVDEGGCFEMPIEIRPVGYDEFDHPEARAPYKYLWVRAAGELPDNPALHKYLMAYASDFGLLTTSLLPHGVSMWQRSMQVASLDHSLWFHRNVRADEWLLFALDSPWAGNGRGFARGSIFNRAGQLVASVAQEGLIRHRPDWE